MQTWLHVLDWRANCDPELLAVRDAHESLTYRQLQDRIERCAAGWHARKVGSGEVVAVLSHNSAEQLVQVLGLMRLGALPLLLNWRMTESEVSRLLDRAEPVAVVADEPSVPLVGEREGLQRITTGRPGGGWEQLPDAAAPAPRPHDRLRAGELAFLMHTSGTTGLPKLIPLDHGSLIRGLAGFALDIGDQGRGDQHLVMLPLFHLAGFAQAMQCFLTGGTLHVHDGFDVDEVVDAIARERINFFTAAPTIIEMLVEAMEGPRRGEDLSSLREVQYGAAPISPELLERAVRSVCGRFRQIYGGTELQGFVSVLRPEDHVPGSPRLASAGQVALGWEARVVDSAGRTLAPGLPGELLVRSENVIDAYWRDPEETDAAFTEDGWYRTGDVAELSQDGYLSIVGRTKEMIISGGENVYPAEIERIIAEHPDVTEVAVVARPDPKWGETPVAFVVLRDGSVSDEERLRAHCRERLAAFKCPAAFVPVAELPRNTLGKVLKVDLRDRAARIQP